MKNEMVLNFDELKKLSQFDQADIVWEIIQKLGFKDATMEPNEDGGYIIELECEEKPIFVENIIWNTDEIDVELNRELPTSVEINLEDFFDYFEEVADLNEENVAIYLNDGWMTEPISFKIN